MSKVLPFTGYLKKFCGKCKSTNIHVDAWAVWDFKKQEWVLEDAFPDTAWCNDCGSSTTVGEVELLDKAEIREEMQRG